MKTLFPILTFFLLLGCGGSTPTVEAAPCARPVLIPERALSDVDVEVFWGRDRTQLLLCGDKVETLSGRKPQ